MPNPTPQEIRTRERFEALIAVAAPLLDFVLAAGDRLSRAVGPDDEYYPIRPPGERFELAPVDRSTPPESPELEPEVDAESDPPA
jgi:hypothetical protein